MREYKFVIEKTCFLKENANDRSKWDYEVNPKVFSGTNAMTVAREAEAYMYNLRDDVLNATVYGGLLEEDPSGIHHFGCDEITFEFEKAIVRLKLMRMVMGD